MGGNKPKRSRAQRIYFVGPAKMREYSKLEGRDADETLDEISPLTWEQAKLALKDMMTMHRAKEPYAIFKIVAVQVKKPEIKKVKINKGVKAYFTKFAPTNKEVDFVCFGDGRTPKKQVKNFSRSELRRRAALKQK